MKRDEKLQTVAFIVAMFFIAAFFSSKYVTLEGRLVRLSASENTVTATFEGDGTAYAYELDRGFESKLVLGQTYMLVFSSFLGFRYGLPYRFVEVSR